VAHVVELADLSGVGTQFLMEDVRTCSGFFLLVLVLVLVIEFLLKISRTRTRRIDCFRKTTGKGGYSGAK
jgi:hypothetical protein